MSRTALFLLVLIAAAAGAGWWYQNRPEPEPSYRTGIIDRGEVTDTVTATGTLNTVKSVQVGSQVSGRIIKLAADFNDKVEAGQLLAEMDPAPYESEIAKAQANLMKAEAATQRATATTLVSRSALAVAVTEVKNSEAVLAKAQATAVNAEKTFQRNSELVRRKLVAQSDLDQSQSDYNRAKADVLSAAAQVSSAKAKVESAKSAIDQTLAEFAANKGDLALARANLDLARTNLGYTNIVSPIKGVVISRNVDIGQTVAASFQAPVLFNIADDLAKMWITANVDEADIGRTREGQDVTFTVDAYPQKKFRGSVLQIRLAPITVQNVVTYHVIIEVDNSKMLLKPGMTSNLSLLVARRRDALRVPNAAIAYNPPSMVRAGEGGGRRHRRDSEGGSAATTATTGEGRRRAEEGASGEAREPRAMRGGAKRRERWKSNPPTGATSSSESGSDDPNAPHPTRIFRLKAGQLEEVPLVAGVTDGTYTEVVSGDVKEGDEVVVGLVRDPNQASQAAGAPNLLRLGGGGGGGGRGGRL